jgi:ATP-dependent helicase HrpA
MMPDQAETRANALAADLAHCLGRDRRALGDRLRRAEQMAAGGRPAERLLASVAADVERSIEARKRRFHTRPRVTFPDDLPVVQKRDEIAAAIAANQVVILCGETGSGKTTQLPKICLELGRGVDGMIGHTQPRRIAARSVAQRIADEIGSPLGRAVGYKVRFGDKTSEDTYVKVMTDGILLAEVQSDRLLEQYDTIIIDEAHERSLNIDFLLGYLKQLLPQRPDLKVIVTSATIDPERFSKHFDGAPIIMVSGRTYPVEVLYRPLRSDDPEEIDDEVEQAQGIAAAVDELARHGNGDVLVFLSGEREIREAAEELRKHHPPSTEILPLYARLSAAEQQAVFKPHGRRRIVLATNVAETSLTVPGIRYVVDTGLARISRYSARTKVQRLPIEPISRASADQRKGRCGRVAEGICIRLYSQEDFEQRPLFTEPEILRTNLAAVILQMKWARLGDIETFPFVERPDPRLIRDGYLTLHELGAVDDENELTQMGRHLGRLPVDPRIGRMILAAERENCLDEVLIIASGLSVQDVRDRPAELAQVADEAHRQFVDEASDFLSYLKIWDFFQEKRKNLSHSQLRKQVKNQFLSYNRLREWADVYEQIHGVVGEIGWKLNDQPAGPDRVHRALLTGLLSNVGNKADTGQYTGTRGAKFFIFPGSVLFKRKPDWVMAAELVETTRLYARTNARVTPEWIERAAEHLLKRTYTDPQWNAQRGDVTAGERVSLRGLILVPHRTVVYGPIDPRTSREIFIHHALVEGEFRTGAPFLRHNMELLNGLKTLEAKARRRDLLADVQQRFRFYDRLVPAGIYNGPLFEQWRKEAERGHDRLLFMSLADVTREDVTDVRPAEYPDELKVGSMKIPLSYVNDVARPDDGVTATIPLALLNQVPAGPFEWLVPGWLHEKVVELIRTLPRPIRTRLVPAPEAAAKAIAGTAGAGRSAPFYEAIAHQLGKIIGEVVPPSLFDVAALPPFLRMNFRVVDGGGKTVASGRDLVQLRAQLGVQARESFAALPPTEHTRDKITRWDFGDVPERVEIRRGGATFSGYPALVDQGTTVAMRVMDSRAASVAANRAGVRRLFMLQLEQELRQLARGFTHVEEMTRAYKPLGKWAELKEQIISSAVDRALFADAVDIRTHDAFVTVARDGWLRLTTAARELNGLAFEILSAFAPLHAQLGREYPPLLLDSINDARQQLRWLVPKDVLSATPPAWLPHLPRYLKALQVRLAKLLNAGLARDQQHLAAMRPLERGYVERRAALAARGRSDPQLVTAWWTMQELRVSLFAQELRTAEKVSVQRVEKLLAAIEG